MCSGGPCGGSHFLVDSTYVIGCPGLRPIASKAVWMSDGRAGVRRTASCSFVPFRQQKNSSGAFTASASHSTRTCFLVTLNVTWGNLPTLSPAASAGALVAGPGPRPAAGFAPGASAAWTGDANLVSRNRDEQAATAAKRREHDGKAHPAHKTSREANRAPRQVYPATLGCAKTIPRICGWLAPRPP